MNQYVVVWHWIDGDVNTTRTQATSARDAEEWVRQRAWQEQSDPCPAREADEWFYVDAIIEGNQLQVRFDAGWGWRS